MASSPRVLNPNSSSFILVGCLALSLMLHLVGFLIWQRFPPTFFRNETLALGTPPMNSLVVLPEEAKAVALKEAFDHMELPDAHFRVPFDVPQLHVQTSLEPIIEPLNPQPLFSEDICKPDMKLLLQQRIDPSQISHYSPMHYLLYFPPLSYVPVERTMTNMHYALPFSSIHYPSSSEEQPISISPSNPLQEPSLLPIGMASYSSNLELSSSKELHAPSLLLPEQPIPIQQKASSFQGAPSRLGIRPQLESLEYYAFPSLAKEVDWSDDFRIETTCMRREGDWLFSITIVPVRDIIEYELPQHFLFLLDRTNPNHKHRFHVYQRAILKALTKLQHQDTFNIAIIDKQVTTFCKTPQKVTLKSLREAEEFLERESPSGFFTHGSLPSSLERFLPTLSGDENVLTAILLSDGFWSQTSKKIASMFSRWPTLNHGKFYAYAATMGEHNDLATLELFSLCNGGNLLWSDTYASFPRKLAKLVLDLQHPVLTDVMVNASPHYRNSRLEFLHPTSSPLPAFRGNTPYTILGRTNALAPFDIVFHGRKHRYPTKEDFHHCRG